MSLITIKDGNGDPIEYNIGGIVDDSNTTDAALGSGETFTGVGTEVLDYANALVNIYAEQDSAIDGLTIEKSIDGSNWRFIDLMTITAGSAKEFSYGLTSKYLRVTYTNGATPGNIELSVVLKKTNQKPSSHRIQDTIVDDDDAELVKAVLTGKNNGSFTNVLVTEDGNLQIVDKSSGLSIAQGAVEGTTYVHKFGEAPLFDTADGEVTVWDGAEKGTAWELFNYVYSTTADIDSLSSSDAGDTHEILIEGLDASYNEVSQTIVLNGQTRVPLTTNLIRVFRAYNDNGIDLAGHVFVYVNGALTLGVPTIKADIRIVIDPDNQQTEMALYTVPAGKTAYMRSFYIATTGGSKLSGYAFRIISRIFGKIFRTKHTLGLSEISPTPYQHEYVEPQIFTEKTDIEMKVTSIASPAAIGNSVSAGFDLVLVDN